MHQIPPPPPPREHATEMKEIPETSWSILLTNKGHEFFYNRETLQSTWDMPEELVDIIGSLLWAEDIPLVNEPDSPAHAVESEHIHGPEHIHAVDRTLPIEQPNNAQLETNHAQKKATEALFIDYLKSLNISPFSIWVVAEPKIPPDARFDILTNKDRKSLFAKYCQLYAAQQPKIAQQNPASLYQTLLDDQVNIRSTYEDFSRKFKYDKKFVSLSDDLKRKQMFNDHLGVIRKAQYKKSKHDFLELLIESNLNSSDTFDSIKLKLGKDPRFAAPLLSKQDKMNALEELKKLH
jgi:hypothetical protein